MQLKSDNNNNKTANPNTVPVRNTHEATRKQKRWKQKKLGESVKDEGCKDNKRKKGRRER